MKFFTVLTALLCALVSLANGYNILGIFTSLSPSHNIVHLNVMKPLIAKGHNVTIISRLPLNEKNLKINHILLPLTTEERAELDEEVKQSTNLTVFKMLQNVISGNNKMISLQYDVLSTPEFQNFLNSGIKVDAVIVGYFFNDFHLAVAAQLKAPIVMSWSAGPMWVANSFTGNPNEVSYVPNLMVTSDSKMNFITRLQNFVTTGLFSIVESVSNSNFAKYYE